MFKRLSVENTKKKKHQLNTYTLNNKSDSNRRFRFSSWFSYRQRRDLTKADEIPQATNRFANSRGVKATDKTPKLFAPRNRVTIIIPNAELIVGRNYPINRIILPFCGTSYVY